MVLGKINQSPDKRKPLKENIDISTLQTLTNQELTYSQICDNLNLERKKSHMKTAQIKNLSNYCNLTRLSNKKYLITEVYDEDIIDVIQYLNQPRQQLLFNIALYKEIINNGSGILFCSNTQLLHLLGEVNGNFSFTFNESNLYHLGEEYLYMASMSKTVYNILMQWTRRKIGNMGFAVIATPAFRLYKDIILDNGDKITDYINISFGNDLYSRCQRVMDEAIDLIQLDKKYFVYDELNNQRIGLSWMPEGLWFALEAKINKLTKQEFKNEGYTRLNTITAFSSASGDSIKRKMENDCIKLQDAKEINQSAKDKIMATIQLNKFSMEQREKYIRYNIDDNPPIIFKDELRRIKKDRRN